LFGTLFSDAADAVAGGSSAHALAGVAIVGNAATATQGVWQYWNGSAWAAIGSVSDGAALIMTAADTLRFVPASDWNGTAPALTVRLIDGSGGAVTSRAVVDLTTTGVGGATAYSAATVALTQEVTPVNDAPAVATATASLTTVKGVAVAVTGLSVSDIDAGSAPVLVTLTAGHGTLTLADGGTDAVITGSGTGTVTIRATVATINALLAATDGLKYTAASYTGADTVTVVVDDQGGSGTGGALTATAAVAVTVVPPNASPVLLDTALAVSTAAEASAVPTAGTVGIAVSSLVGLNGAGTANVTDGDSGAVTGIALVGTHETYGHWWFSTDGGANWALVGTVNDTDAALLLRPADRLYFQPNAAVPETVSGALTIRAWDQTTGTHGTKATVDTSAGSAFSGQTDTVTLHPAVLVANGSFDHGLTGWLSTGGASATTGGDGHQGTLTSAVGKTSGELETYLGLSTGAIAAAVGATPSAGHAMKLASTITVTKDTTLSFDWSFAFSDTGYFDFGFVSVNGTVTLLAKAESKSGTFHVVIPANTTVSLGFGVSDTTDNSVNPVLTVDNIRLTTVASDPIVLDMTGHGLSLRPLSDGVRFDVTGDGVADQTGWIGAGNALLARDTNHDGRIDSAHELVSEKFGTGFNSSLEALASLDGNHDGRIDAADADYGTLLVWQDADGDGVSRPGELKTLAQAGIASIMTTATPTDASVAGNRVLGTTSMTMADGTQHEVAGVSFDVKAGVDGVVQSHAAGPGTPDSGIGGSDFAAMLRTALGTPHPAATPQDPAGTEASAWVADTHDSGTYPHPPGDTQVAYSPH
ncbi:beta strand repeat-containing protein, partial [Azospirillum sp.]|uniref:beta strand repeat-containing protein n=1 Tax=Azospirillum sp. TaxID=34012 RepID=UPI003D70F12D